VKQSLRYLGGYPMVLLDIKLKNFLLFNDFSMNLSYPKKTVNSSIENEHLVNRPNFRYKKLIVLMGANASGKTALGKVLISDCFYDRVSSTS
jgi:hypothetical protein